MSMHVKVVDGDGHVQEPEAIWEQYLEPKYRHRAPQFVVDEQGRSRREMLDGQLMPYLPRADVETHYPHTLRPGGYKPHERVNDLDLEGIDTAVLFPSMALRYQGLQDANLVGALCRAYNNWISDFCKTSPKRLVGVGLAPLQDLDMAIEEAQRAVTLGLRGIFIRPNLVNGRNWHHPFYDHLWSVIQELGVPVTFHEGTTMNCPTAGTDRFEPLFFKHIISHPFEQQLACLAMIVGGVLERFPGLKLGFLESGVGWVWYWLDRMDEHAEKPEMWSYSVKHLKMKPSDYFRRQCWISGEPQESMMPAIAAYLGDDRVIWASDYPHPDAIFPGAVKALTERTDIPEVSKRKILGANAVALYGLR